GVVPSSGEGDEDGNGCGDGGNGGNGSSGQPSNPPIPPRKRDPGQPVTTANPFDPNDKRGPSGYGSSNYLINGLLLPYRIDFENSSSASAPAQQVVITDQLSTNVDWNSFAITEIAFGDTLITPPSNVQHFQTTRSMTYRGQTFNVQIEIGINLLTGLIT